MNYKKEPNSNYQQHRPKLHIQKSLNNKVKRKKKTEWKVDLLTRTPSITKKEEEELTPMPEVIEDRKRTSLGFNVGNQIGTLGVHGEKENTEIIDFGSRQIERPKKIPKSAERV